MNEAQKQVRSYDLRSGVRPGISTQNLEGDHLSRVKQAHHRVSEKKGEEVTTSNIGKRFSGMEQIPLRSQRKGTGSPDRMQNRSPENSGHVSIGLFEDVDPEDLDEEEVIWSNKSQLMSTPYADWREKRPESGALQNPRRKEILRKQQEQEKRQPSPEGLAWWEEAVPAPSRERTNTGARMEKNLETSAEREQLHRTYQGAERIKNTEADDRRIEIGRSNTSTSSMGRMYVKPPKFDGRGCAESHLLQFQVAASRNHWNEEEKVDFLKISLTGEASAILKDVGDVTYEELANKLKQCYGSLEQKEVFKIQLKARKRKKGETLAELMRDIRRLFIQAYPAQNDVLSTSVAKDAFIDALEDKELMIRVMEREPQTLDEAYKIAERMELYTKKVNLEDREGESKHKGISTRSGPPP